MVVEDSYNLGDRRSLLAHRHVDALHAFGDLVNDRVDTDGGLTRLAVADDQLSLASADRHHRVDSLDAGLERLMYGLAVGHARRLNLEAADRRCVQRTFAVERVSERVDHPSKQLVTDGNRQDLTGCPNFGALFQGRGLTQHHRTDRFLVKVQSQTLQTTGELEHLVHGDRGKARNPSDSVADLDDSTDLLKRGLGAKTFEVAFDCCRDIGGVQVELCHGDSEEKVKCSLSGTIT